MKIHLLHKNSDNNKMLLQTLTLLFTLVDLLKPTVGFQQQKHHHQQQVHNEANYELIENDSRYISYQDLMTTAKKFAEAETSTYSELLFDVARNQLIVGARDILYRLSFDLELLERANWEATPAQIAMCQAKGQSEQMCRNYVRVLQTYGENLLYACGTYAFNPNCTWRQMENLTVTGYDSGVGKCPFNPKSNITSLMTQHGKMFVGTTTDFSGSDAAILKSDVQKNVPNHNKVIRTKQYNNDWLNNPQFVGSFEAGNFVYFLFREPAVEYMNCGKAIYSRIARVCKNDAGGDQILRDNWTSFLKARLNCSLPGEYPFYFDEIQGMTYSHDENVLYATFTTPYNSIHGSAVCAYNLTSINEAFDGSFKHQEHADYAWRAVRSSHNSQFKCQMPSANTRSKHLLESSKYQLMDQAVQPITEKPLYYSKLERFSQIALDILHTKTEKVNVLFINTDRHLIKKLSLKHETELSPAQTCLVEVWKTEGDNILNMEYLKVTDSLYVASEQSLTRIPAHHCNRHVSKDSCLNAMDPYCGWNELVEKCTAQYLREHVTKYWLQPENLKCPVLTAAVDGGWSTWSDWYRCSKHGETDGDCMCRARECNNPQPQNGGNHCEGIHTEVSNCTVHGGWTEWSAWSSCSQTCGIAVKTRRRICGNPKPAFGGRTCVGPERGEMYCSHLPPCPAPKPVAIDGGWGPWGEWSECSVLCGGGFRIRRRECNDPKPQNGGTECPGCNIDYEDCNMQSCQEVRKLSGWTPWLIQQNKTDDSEGSTVLTEKRFRFVCRASTPDAGSVHIGLAKTENRICRDGVCHRHNEASAMEETEHNEWSPCNVTCGGGIQHRGIGIDGSSSKHRGRHVQSRACNMHPCPELPTSFNEVVSAHEWSCWTDWSPCSVTCGVGLRRRTRKCLGGHEKLCHGRSLDEEKCEMKPCEDFIGWSSWSEWSDCTKDGIRFRHRKCLVEEPSVTECRGEEFEKTACVPGECEGTQVASTSTLVSIIATVILLYALTIFMTFWMTRRRYLPPVALMKNNTPSPTSYDSYPNQYSSLPTKDIYDVRPKVKRQSSFNMCSSPTSKNFNTGTLNRNNIAHNHTPKVLAKTYNDCETGTLKRNSNALNNYRTNIDDEKF